MIIPSRGILAVLLVLGMALLSTSILAFFENEAAIRMNLSDQETGPAAMPAASAPR